MWNINKILMVSAYSQKMLLSVVCSIIDWLTFNIALLLCYIFGLWPTGNAEVMLIDCVVANISYVIAHNYVVISFYKRFSSVATIFRNVFRSSILIGLFNAAFLGMAHMIAPGFFRTSLMIAIVFFMAIGERCLVRYIIRHSRYNGDNKVLTVVVGYSGMTTKVLDVISDKWNGMSLLGIFSNYEDAVCKNEPDVTFLGKIADVEKWLLENKVDEIYFAHECMDDKMMLRLLKICEQKMVRVYYIPQTTPMRHRKSNFTDFGETYVISHYNEPLMRGMNRMKKRIFDIIVSVIFLCTVFPFIYIIVMIISKITMPGPVFFKQLRTGYDGKDFYCYKFRSMKVNKDADKVQATKDDPRVTRWGYIMRHTNIDELPQFINVLKGDMSIVGPRPHMLAHTEYYSNLIGDYMIRHYVRPGVTGWAQTHGERGETKTVEDMARRVEKDIWYIEHWSFWLDIQIMIKTVTDIIVGDKKAY